MRSPLSPDYVTNVFKHVTSPQKRRAQNSLVKFKQRQTWKKKKRNDEQGAAHAVVGLSGQQDNTALDQEIQQEEDHLSVPSVSDSPSRYSQSVSTQYDMTVNDLNQLERESQNLRTERFDLPSRYKQLMFLLKNPSYMMQIKLNASLVYPTTTYKYSCLSRHTWRILNLGLSAVLAHLHTTQVQSNHAVPWIHVFCTGFISLGLI